MRALLAAAAGLLGLAAAGCGGSSSQGGTLAQPDPDDQARARHVVTRLSDLPSGWRVQAAGGSVLSLGPSLARLTIRGEADSAALTRSGAVVRSSAAILGSPGDAAEAFRRAAARSFVGFLGAKRVTALRYPGAVARRMKVPRPAEPGSDTVELFVLRRGQALAVVEFVSADGFDARTRDRVLSRVEARLEEVAARAPERMDPAR